MGLGDSDSSERSAKGETGERTLLKLRRELRTLRDKLERALMLKKVAEDYIDALLQEAQEYRDNIADLRAENVRMKLERHSGTSGKKRKRRRPLGRSHAANQRHCDICPQLATGKA